MVLEPAAVAVSLEEAFCSAAAGFSVSSVKESSLTKEFIE